MLARFEITPALIEAVVARFYAQVRRDDLIGPIFADHVQDWTAHEAKIAEFWGNAILLQRGYDGNPMQIHMGIPGLTQDHFVRWLFLFDQVLGDCLTPHVAQAWSGLAHRIGRGLRAGLVQPKVKGQPPTLLCD